MYQENGNIRYTNKNACKHCKNRNKCYKGKNEWKEIDFTKDTLEKACKEWLEAEGKEYQQSGQETKVRYEKVKVVKFTLKPSQEKCARGCVCPSIRLEPSNEQWEQPIFS